MMPPATVLYAFEQSDGFARAIVLLLGAISIYAWTVMLDKRKALRKARRENLRFAGKFHETPVVCDMHLFEEFKDGPLADIYDTSMHELSRVLGAADEVYEQYCRERRLPRLLTDREMDRVRNAMERTVSARMVELQRNLGVLGTVVSVSPFLGLLGTVWGVMMAFCRMAQAGRPDIGAMAPGISGALLTTVVGLVVAIPAVVGYNLLVNGVKEMVIEMDDMTDEISSRIRDWMLDS